MNNTIFPESVAASQVNINSTLKDLYLYSCQLDQETQCRFALQNLNVDPKLPGILLMENFQLIGMISRRRLLEQVSRPYGLELFLDRPLIRLYQYTKIDHLILSEDTLIKDAAQQALKRPSPSLDEPVVVKRETNQYALLDIHQLLTAYANIFQMTTILLEKQNQQLQHLAVIDKLTGIGNRRFFDQYFSRDWQFAIREKQWITLVMIDVDYFKKYNDNHGHPAGDECLRQVAALLQSHCKRSTDIVSRYGGEEFVLSLLNTKLEQAIILVERIQESLATLKIPHPSSPISSYLTLSYGIATVKPLPGQNGQALLKLADQSLYQAKENGRNQYACLTKKKK